MAYEVTTVPATDAITLTEAKNHLKVDTTADDTLITEMLKTAQNYFESKTNQKLITQTIKEYFDSFPSDELKLQLFPVKTITAVNYIDENGVTQIWSSSNYHTDKVSRKTRIVPAENQTFPETQDTVNAVWVEHIVGYGDQTAVPQEFKNAIKLLIADLYENRTDRRFSINLSRAWDLIFHQVDFNFS